MNEARTWKLGPAVVGLAVCLCGLLGQPWPSSAQVLSNGDFEQGRAGWSLSQQEGAKAEFRVVPSGRPGGGKVGRLTVLVNGAPHHLQLMHSFPTSALTPGGAYVLRFWARAEQETSIRVCLLARNRPWPSLGLRETVPLSRQWQPYALPFRAKKVDQPFAKVDFFLGEAEGTVWLDDVRIEPFDPGSVRPDGPVIETEQWRLELFANGALGRLTHRPTGRVLVEPALQPAAYEVTLVENGRERRVSSREARRVQRQQLPGGGWQFTFEHPELVVELSYRPDPATGLLACRAAVQNRSQAAVTKLRFPIVTAPLTLGRSSDDDVLLYPVFDGMVVDSPATVFGERETPLAETYPGPLSCQVMAFCDPEAGLYLATHDPDGYPKVFAVSGRFHLTLSVTHLAPILPGKDLRLTYPVVVGPFAAAPPYQTTTWYDAAEIYRRWAQAQPWAQPKLATRPDVPEWLRRGGLVTFYNPRRLTPPGDTSRLKAFLQDYTQRFGLSVLANNRGFERYGEWCGQEYLPPWPDEQTFRQSAEVARSLGGLSMVMLSGYRWTIERTTPEGEPYSSQDRFDREVRPWVVHGPDGQPVVHVADRPNDWHGQKWAELCRATEFAKKTVVDLAEYFVRHGYSVIHFDQEVSGAYSAAVCWAKHHGHPPGHGRWVHLALADLYDRICKVCRPLDPNFMLSMEEPNELYIPWLNLCQTRPFGITREWPVVPPGTRSVPLFLYLYHDSVVCWAAFYPWKSAGRPWYSVAKGFAIGVMPGLVPPQNLRLERPETRDWLLKLFQNCVVGYRTFARPYLVEGKMLRPLELSVPTRRLSISVRGRSYEQVVPTLWHSVWSLPDGRVGVVLVNAERKRQSVALDLTPLTRSDTPASVREVSVLGPARRHSELRFELTVEPLDLVLVELVPGQDGLRSDGQ